MIRTLLALAMIMLLAVGCAEQKEPEAAKQVQPAPPGQIRASHILIAHADAARTSATRTKEEAKVLADDLAARIKAGEDFAELARTHSDCPTAPKGGDLGFFPKGRMVPEFEIAAFGLEVDGISEIVETQFGYHIIKRTQ